MDSPTNGSSFLPDMREDAADSAPSSPLFSERSPVVLPTSSLSEPLFPPLDQDYSTDSFASRASPESDFSSELGFQGAGLFPPPPTPLPPIADLLRAVDENWLAPPDLLSISYLEEAIASEGAGDSFLGFPNPVFAEIMEDVPRPSLSYDASRSSFVPNFSIQAEDATSSSFPLPDSLRLPPALVDFSSWPGFLPVMNDFEADTTLSLPPLSSLLHEAYPTMEPSFPGPIPFDTWGFEQAERLRERERDPWVDLESYGDECSTRCPRCGWSAPTPPVESLTSWLHG